MEREYSEALPEDFSDYIDPVKSQYRSGSFRSWFWGSLRCTIHSYLVSNCAWCPFSWHFYFSKVMVVKSFPLNLASSKMAGMLAFFVVGLLLFGYKVLLLLVIEGYLMLETTKAYYRMLLASSSWASPGHYLAWPSVTSFHLRPVLIQKIFAF